MARRYREDPMKDAIGAASFALVIIALVLGLIFGRDAGMQFLFGVSERVVRFVMPGLLP